MDIFLLDANAILAYFGNEPGVENIRSIFNRAESYECRVYIHAANAYEVFYLYYRDKGEIDAMSIWDDINSLPIQILYSFTEEFAKTAGRLKATFKISVSDSFLLAQAQLLNAQVVTSDHHEFDVVEKSGVIQFNWYR